MARWPSSTRWSTACRVPTASSLRITSTGPAGDAAADLDDRHLVEQRLEVAGVQFGADDDQPRAAVAQQLVDHRVLAAARGERAEQQVVAQLLDGRVHVLDQLDLERAAQREQHAEGAAAVARAGPGRVSRAGSPVSAAACEHPLARGVGGARRAPRKTIETSARDTPRCLATSAMVGRRAPLP